MYVLENTKLLECLLSVYQAGGMIMEGVVMLRLRGRAQKPTLIKAGFLRGCRA